ncbi:MAG: hypothetical protein QXQ37_03520 [Nitrososphaerota archaeon]
MRYPFSTFSGGTKMNQSFYHTYWRLVFDQVVKNEALKIMREAIRHFL